MNSLTPTALPKLLPAITEEEIDRLDLFLPTVNVISYAGPGASGGVPVSLEPVVKKLGTRVNWFALSELPHGDFTPEQDARGGFTFYAPQAPKRLFDAHQSVVNGYLWDLLHGFLHKSQFDPEAWKSYRALCELVASQCITTASESFPTICWLHDYQLALASPILASQAGIVLSQFWHAPWPSAATIADSPVGSELTRALLHNKLIGFHTDEYADNFLATVTSLIDDAQVDSTGRVIRFQGRTISIVVLPLGVDINYWQKLAEASKPASETIACQHGLTEPYILGVERLEYTKGVLERLNGLELLLKTNPNYLKHFHYVQIAQPGKQSGSAQLEYANLVEEKITAINKQFERDGWQPIKHLKGNLDQLQLTAWYQGAAALSINSLSDGLNIIAKEFVASRIDEQGALILSRHAGCAREMSQGAWLIDPKSPQEICDAFKDALSADALEKKRRMVSMRHVLHWNQLQNWALNFLRMAMSK